MTCGIYRIVHVASGRCYVGQAKDIPWRWKGHLKLLRKGAHHSTYLQNAWNKYGPEAFELEVLEECPIEMFNEREQFWIDELKSAFNISRCTTSFWRGMKHSAETRAKLSEKGKGRKLTEDHKRKIGEGNRGKFVSEETRERIRQAALNMSEETKKKMSESGRKKKFSDDHRHKIGDAGRGLKRSPETKEKLRIAALGNQRTLGQKRSEEAKQRMRIAQRIAWAKRKEQKA